MRLFSVILLIFATLGVVCGADKIDKVSVDSSAILETVLCIIKPSPWQCARQQAGKVLDNWDNILESKRKDLMDEADVEATKKYATRGFSENETAREKPSVLMDAIENGLGTVSEYVSDGVDEYVLRKREDQVDIDKTKKKKIGSQKLDTDEDLARGVHEDDDRLVENEPDIAHGRKGDDHDDFGYGGGGGGGIGGGGHGGYGGGSLDRTDDEDEDDVVGHFGRGKNKHKKKRRTFMKLFVLGAALKAKIELLLKVLSFHLQLKFFAIAAIGLLVNIARFWVDLKKGHQPQKVIYYEHAQHQHHYDEHGGEDYGGGGGYWKRSLNVPNSDEYAAPIDKSDRVRVNYQEKASNPSHHQYDAQNMAYEQQRPY